MGRSDAEALYERLRAAAARCGVVLTSAAPNWEDEGWYECPFASRYVDGRTQFTAGVNYEKHIVFALETVGVHVLIHELGHVIACPVGVEDSSEGSWLWWEAATAFWLNCLEEWREKQGDYYLTNDYLRIGNRKWGTLKYDALADVSPRSMLAYARASLKHGQDRGLFDAEGPCRSVERVHAQAEHA